MALRRFVLPLGLLLVASVAASNCGTPSPVGVDARAPALAASRGSHQPGGDAADDGDDPDEEGDSLVSCRLLPYESVTQTIGPEGGVLEVRRNWLVVPRGALKDPVTITAVAPSDTLALVRFQPEGLRFLTTAYLVVAYDNCRVKRTVTPRIAHVTDALNVIEFLPAVTASPADPRFKKMRNGHQQIVGQLEHFSNYAVAW
jgi:hypothetical protein